VLNKQNTSRWYLILDASHLVNHVGFVCLAFSLLSALQQHNRAKLGNIKRTIQNQLYSKRDGIDRFNQKIAS
jgi:uncharacterized membrane-anchored protein